MKNSFGVGRRAFLQKIGKARHSWMLAAALAATAIGQVCGVLKGEQRWMLTEDPWRQLREI